MSCSTVTVSSSPEKMFRCTQSQSECSREEMSHRNWSQRVGVGPLKTRPTLAMTDSHAARCSLAHTHTHTHTAQHLLILHHFHTHEKFTGRNSMDSNTVFRSFCLVLVFGTNLSGTNAEKSSSCVKSEFFNNDIGSCVPCATCIQFPKTPGCTICPPVKPHDSWRVAAITSFSVLAAVVVFGALLIGVLVHQCRSKRTLSEPIEETTGPLYPV